MTPVFMPFLSKVKTIIGAEMVDVLEQKLEALEKKIKDLWRHL